MQAVERSLWLGRVYDKAGSVMADWNTVRAREEVVIRSNVVACYKYCDRCGGLYYAPAGRRWGLIPAPSETVIYQDPIGRLVLHESLVSQDLYNYRRKLSIWRIGVFQRPPDGLPERLELWKTPS